jgi:hypothetical protein
VADRRKHRRGVAGLTILLAVMFAAVWWWRHEPPTAPQGAVPPTGTEQMGSAAPTERSEPPPDPDGPVPASALPAEIASLLSRADAGDAAAACQLGVRLNLCTRAAFFSDERLDALRAQEAKQHAKGDLAGANSSAATLLKGTRIRQQCDGVPEALQRRAFDYLRQAALAGEPEAVIRYSRGQHLAGRSSFGFIRTPQFDTWRREALPMLEARLAAGHPEAVLVMLEARGEANFLSMVTPRDPTLDLAYRLLARRLFGEHPSLRRHLKMHGFTPGQRREAERLAEDWHQQRFGARKLEIRDHLVGLVDAIDDEHEFRWPQPSRLADPCSRGLPEAGP